MGHPGSVAAAIAGAVVPPAVVAGAVAGATEFTGGHGAPSKAEEQAQARQDQERATRAEREQGQP